MRQKQYSLDTIQGLNEYKVYQSEHGECAITDTLSQALVHKVRLSPAEYNEHLVDRMKNGESLKFFVLKNENNEPVAAAMGWRRGTVSNGPRVQIQCIAVDTKHRGDGVFNKFMDAIKERIRDEGYKGMDIEVGINSLVKNAGLYLHAGCNPNEVMFALDVSEKTGRPSHAARLNQGRSLAVLSDIFGEQRARL